MFPGEPLDLDPLLNPLGSNGGSTPTHTLQVTSPALDSGDPAFDPLAFTPPLDTDQRGTGFDRVVGDRVDIGAFELDLDEQNVLLINNPEPGSDDRFGANGNVAISNGVVAIGVPFDDPNGLVDAGSVYLFDSSGQLIITLSSPNPQTGALFGWSIAIEQNTVVVGAKGQDVNGASNAGAAYVFDTSGSLLSTNENPFPQQNAEFGNSIAVEGNTMVVGAWSADLQSSPRLAAGRVYVFDGGALLTIIDNPSPGPELRDNFGFKVDIEDGVIAVGAQRDDPNGLTNAGSVYLYSTNGNLLRTVAPPTLQPDDRFGWDLAMEGNTLVVGARTTNFGGVEDSGAAYIFSTDGTLLSTLAKPNPIGGEQFGISVAIQCNTVVVGAWQDLPGGIQSAGGAYIFRTDGTLVSNFTRPDPQQGDAVGQSVAIDSETIVVSAGLADFGDVIDVGGVYLIPDSDTTSSQCPTTEWIPPLE